MINKDFHSIGVIVPVYNVEKYLHRCIDSILSQSFTDFELILIDDGSNDSSGNICDSYKELDKRVVVFHKENGGQSSARNLGIEYALKSKNIKWITFVDSDDWVSNDYLLLLHSNSIRFNAEVSCCDYIRVINENIKANDQISDIIIGEPEHIWLDFLRGESYPVGKLYPITFFEGFRFTTDKIYEDTASIHILLFQAHRIVFEKKTCYYYFYNPNSTTTTIWTPKKLDALWAHEQQLNYFKNTKYVRSYNHVLSLYIACIAQSLQKLAEYKGFRCYSMKYRIKLRYYLIFKRKCVDYKKYKKDYYYKSAYPFAYKIIKRVHKKVSNAIELFSGK